MDRYEALAIALTVAVAIAFGVYVYYKNFVNLSFTTDTATLVMSTCVLKKSVHLYYGFKIFKPLCHIIGCYNFVLFLNMLMVGLLSLAGYFLYKLARLILGDALGAIMIQALYYLNPMVHALYLFGIHSDAFVLFFAVLGLYVLFRYEDKPLIGYFTLALGMLFKETAIFPLAGAFLWRLVHKKLKLYEIALAGLFVIGVVVAYFTLTSLPMHFIKGRYITSLEWLIADVEIFAIRKVIFFALLFLTVPLGFLSPLDFAIALPNFLNIFWTAVTKAYTKFVIGYQYQGTLAAVLLVASILAIKHLKIKRFRIALISLIVIVALADIWISPIGFIYLASGRYPVPQFVTYRVPLNDSCCLNSAMNLVKFSEKIIPPGSKVLVDDQISPFFACKYETKRAGLLVFPYNVLTAPMTACQLSRFLIKRAADYFVNLPGLTMSIDMNPKYLSILCTKIWWAPHGGYVCQLANITKAAEKICSMYIKNGINAYKFVNGMLEKSITFRTPWIDWGYAHFNNPALLTELAPYLPPYIPVLSTAELYSFLPGGYGVFVRENPHTMVFSGKIYIPMNGTYLFEVHSDDGSVLFIDGKPILNCWGPHICNEKVEVYLTKGEHNIIIDYKNFYAAGMLKVGWKPPYACKVEPISATYLTPRPIEPFGAITKGGKRLLGFIWPFNRTATLRGYFEVTKTSTYQFKVLGNATLYIDGKLVNGTITLREGIHEVVTRGKNFEVMIKVKDNWMPLIYPLVRFKR
ncbi:hypothetical protein IPA_03360 [Ignicoccus pacificus DSM 13166]|uniref:PA14 domain-containing protein n=1 Tax=Ignicoccus pacificus DSM 13166 TaxID=940294 RepID=A0A977PLA7_9CREN|nr:hypothetical protein IPA_03360 [Ignicoccus pacificus DSM 13166]